jgi:hypothetical protein
MKLRLIVLDRASGDQHGSWVWDLERKNLLMLAYLHFANGLDWQTRIEGDTQEALDVARGLARGAGSCQRLASMNCLTPELKEGRCLYQEGDECYLQGEAATGSLLFIDPKVRARRIRRGRNRLGAALSQMTGPHRRRRKGRSMVQDERCQRAGAIRVVGARCCLRHLRGALPWPVGSALRSRSSPRSGPWPGQALCGRHPRL